MRRLSVVLLLGSVGCVGATRTVLIAAPAAQAAQTVQVAVNITIGQPLIERDARLALAQHGRWQSSSLGELWIPTVAEREEFAPFVTHGHWQQSAQGPQWASQFTWGSIVFHYGQWVRVGSLWGWRFDGGYSPSTVLWRRSGRHVGWSVSAHDEWCWLAFEELYSTVPWRSLERGRGAAPIAATSVDVARPEIELAVGWGPPGGPSSSPDTTRGQQRIESAPSENRWATVVIRDDRAEQDFEQLGEYEHSAPSTSSVVPVSSPTSPSGAARQAPAFARVSPSATSATSTLWGDQERLRAPVVANIDPRFTPHAMQRQPVTVVQPAAPAQPPSAPRPSEPTVQPSGSAMVGGGSVAVPTIPTRTPSVVTTPASVVLPTVVTTGAATRVR